MIRDRGSNFTAAFDEFLADAGIRTVLCNVETTRMNATAERWIGGCRRELLDRLGWARGCGFQMLFQGRPYPLFLADVQPGDHRAELVEHGKVITAAGVSAGIDMALALLARMHGPQLAQMVQLGIEYDTQPPFDAGSRSKAPRRTTSTGTHASMDCPQGERRE